MGQKPSRPIVAQPQVNVSGHIPWDPISTMIGGGYDVQRYRTQQTAFIETPDIKHQNSKCAVDMKYTSKVVRTHEELEEGIRLSCGLSVPVGLGAANEASLDYIRSIKCSATSMTTIISCEIGFPSEKCVSRPRLSSEADALLARDPKMFTEQYGQYFVSGQQRRSTFLAICSHNSSSKEQLDDFKVKLGANFQVASFEAAADYMQSAKSSKLTTTIEIQTSGYQGDKVLIFMTTDIMPILRAFLKNYAPTPYLALMTDYSCIDIRASRQHESLTLPHDLDDAFQKVCVLEIRAKSCTRLGAQKVLPEISNLRQDITRVHLSASDWRVRLSEWEEKIRASQDLVDEWWERQALLERAAKRSAEQWSSSSWYKAPGKTELETGLCHIKDFQSLAPEVRHDILRFPEDSCDGKSLKHNCNGRRIVGVKVKSLEDDNNGRWRLSEGWVGYSSLAIEIKSTTWKVDWALGNKNCNLDVRKEKVPCSCTVEVWSVDSEKYARHV